MKRPLFLVCLFIMAVIALLTLFGVFDADKHTYLLPESRQKIDITCSVCKTDSSGYYVNKIKIVDSAYDLPQKYIFYIPCDSSYESAPDIGNRLQLTAVFRPYSHSTNPGEFDSFDYYSSLNIYGSLSEVSYTITDSRHNYITCILNQIKKYGTDSISINYSQPEASIMNDLLFGDKAGLDTEIKELYRRNGISHILSISSLHISIIGLGLFALMKKMQCPQWLAAIISAVVLIMFGIMTGMSISAARAIGIYLIGVFARLTGRTTDRLTSIALVATILLIINPGQLTSCGFLLSFSSVLGICCLFPAFKKLVPDHSLEKIRYHADAGRNRIKKRLRLLLSKIGESLLAGLSISLTTLPIQLYFFYEIPTYSSVINLMVIPLLSILMISGYLSAFLPFLQLPTILCTLILRFFEMLGKLFDLLPFCNWNPGRPWWGVIIAYYLFWLIIVLLPAGTRLIKKCLLYTYPASGHTIPVLTQKLTQIYAAISSMLAHRSIRLIVRLSPLAVIFIFIPLFNSCRLPVNSIIFMNVGQGDCILLYTDSKEVLLFDGGSSSRSSPGKSIIKGVLKYYGFSHINSIYVSHFDSDHTNGIIELLENRDKWHIKIDSLYVPFYQGYDSESGYQQLISAVNMQRCVTNIEKISKRNIFYHGSARLTCLNPDSNYPYEDSNSASMCILVDFMNSHIHGADKHSCTSLLLCGDVAGQGEEQLAEAMYVHSPVTLLKVAHHGSKYSTSDAFLDIVRPYYAFISAGKNNIYGHPHPDTLSRLSAHGCQYYSTADCGAVTVTVYSNRLTLNSFRN